MRILDLAVFGSGIGYVLRAIFGRESGSEMVVVTFFVTVISLLLLVVTCVT